MAYLTPEGVNDKTKWLTRVEAARYIGVSLSEFAKIEDDIWLVKHSKQFTVIHRDDKSKPVDLVFRYYVPDLESYIRTNGLT